MRGTPQPPVRSASVDRLEGSPPRSREAQGREGAIRSWRSLITWRILVVVYDPIPAPARPCFSNGIVLLHISLHTPSQ